MSILDRRGNPGGGNDDLASLEAGLDALETTAAPRRDRGRRFLSAAWPPALAIVVLLGIWELIYRSGVKPTYALPSPADVGLVRVHLAQKVRVGPAGFSVVVDGDVAVFDALTGQGHERALGHHENCLGILSRSTAQCQRSKCDALRFVDSRSRRIVDGGRGRRIVDRRRGRSIGTSAHALGRR